MRWPCHTWRDWKEIRDPRRAKEVLELGHGLNKLCVQPVLAMAEEELKTCGRYGQHGLLFSVCSSRVQDCGVRLQERFGDFRGTTRIIACDQAVLTYTYLHIAYFRVYFVFLILSYFSRV